jgi:hypothetical protein
LARKPIWDAEGCSGELPNLPRALAACAGQAVAQRIEDAEVMKKILRYCNAKSVEPGAVLISLEFGLT